MVRELVFPFHSLRIRSRLLSSFFLTFERAIKYFLSFVRSFSFLLMGGGEGGKSIGRGTGGEKGRGKGGRKREEDGRRRKGGRGQVGKTDEGGGGEGL